MSNTTVDFYGPAYSVRKGDELLAWLQNRQDMTPEEKNRAMLMFQNHNSDPVGGLPIVGGNPGTGGTIPEGSSGFVQAVRAATGREDTVHNCYGKGNPNCKDFWNDSPNNKPVSQPARPELLQRENGK